MAQHRKISREIVEEAKGVGIAVIGLAILFGLSVGVALFFTTYDSAPIPATLVSRGKKLAPAPRSS